MRALFEPLRPGRVLGEDLQRHFPPLVLVIPRAIDGAVGTRTDRFDDLEAVGDEVELVLEKEELFVLLTLDVLRLLGIDRMLARRLLAQEAREDEQIVLSVLLLFSLRRRIGLIRLRGIVALFHVEPSCGCLCRAPPEPQIPAWATNGRRPVYLTLSEGRVQPSDPARGVRLLQTPRRTRRSNQRQKRLSSTFQ